MKLNNIFGVMLLMILLVTSVASARPPQELNAVEGLTLEIVANEFHEYNTTYPVHLHLYDTKTGLPLDNTTATCYYHLYNEITGFRHLDKGTFTYDDYDFEAYIGGGNFTEAQTMLLLVWCETETQGGFKQIFFDVMPEEISIGVFGLWKPVDNWIFPGIYLLLTIILLALAFAYESQMMGVLGSLMLIMAYFIVGATSPILFAPLLIVGFLLGFKFATI